MKKIVSLFVIIGVILICLSGCRTSKSYTYNVETGDSIEIELDTSNGYNMTSKIPFTIYKNDVILSQGMFITIEGYNKYLESINNDSNAKVLESNVKDDITYIFYSYNNSEFNYLIKINGSNTGVLLGNPNSQEEAEECFKKLIFSLKK